MEITKSHIRTILKIGVTFCLIYLVYTKIDFLGLYATIAQANTIIVGLALVLFLFSQGISADRLLEVLHAQGYLISRTSNYRLYLVGMFYNFFVPGGIGGDAYKVYVLHQKWDWSIRKLTTSIFLDRFMGLVAIAILLTCGVYFILPPDLKWIRFMIPIGIVSGIALAYWIIRKWLPTFLGVFRKTLLLSLAVQGLQCLCVICLCLALSGTSDHLLSNYWNSIPIYVFVFLISSVLSLFSFSGIGVREMLFYQAAAYFNFQETTAVSIGAVFSALTALVSIFGLAYPKKAAWIRLQMPKK